MRRSFLAVIVLTAAACVDVPDGVRAQFAGPGPADRSNYRHGPHGSAPPAEPEGAPVVKAADAAITGAAVADGGAAAALAPAEPTAADGGAP